MTLASRGYVRLAVRSAMSSPFHCVEDITVRCFARAMNARVMEAGRVDPITAASRLWKQTLEMEKQPPERHHPGRMTPPHPEAVKRGTSACYSFTAARPPVT